MCSCDTKSAKLSTDSTDLSVMFSRTYSSTNEWNRRDVALRCRRVESPSARASCSELVHSKGLDSVGSDNKDFFGETRGDRHDGSRKLAGVGLVAGHYMLATSHL
ncbi:hypothetical protein AG1IA_00005 [Rhizoctonia solani AG-1 IA]|uniref:Uncharacterized protein n=1 Tax=Thanatephorus cucumeris (strain AG1-IA) TaxID=983506 RepID=L8X6X6_THACA|nr:hypothetical protein AG1IA_00005 [Rhizoctonia solani AG-1 IA]